MGDRCTPVGMLVPERSMTDAKLADLLEHYGKTVAAAERARIVAWIRTGLMRVAGQNPDDAALFRLVATMIERGEHAQPEPARREEVERST